MVVPISLQIYSNICQYVYVMKNIFRMNAALYVHGTCLKIVKATKKTKVIYVEAIMKDFLNGPGKSAISPKYV